MGEVYEGPFQYPITIKNLCCCLDHLLSITSVTIFLIDKFEKKVYIYGQKRSFFLKDKSEIYVNLLNDTKKDKGRLKLKFDNEWFYK